MICFNGFRFFNENKEHILDGEAIAGDLTLTVYAGDEMENFAVSQEEVLELAEALVNLVEEARMGYDTTTRR